jgi:GDP-L-fucose synthase
VWEVHEAYQMKSSRGYFKVYVAGHNGMVGSALCRRLDRRGYTLLTPSSRLDLRKQNATNDLLERLRPDWVFIAAAKVGGIIANSTYPAEFIYDNLMVQTNLIHSAYVTGVKKLMFLGSSCIYPRLAQQPIKEEYLLSGYLEPTNKPYAVAKIAGIIMAQSYNKQYGTNFISVMPTNLYGEHDNFDLQNSHVIPGIMRRIHEAKVSGADHVEVWGSGKPFREFLHVDDLADACVFLMENYNGSEIVNIGSGSEISIRDLALLIADVVGYQGQIKFNPQYPDGMPRKLLDISRIKAIGWEPSIPLREGILSAYRWYAENEKHVKIQ